MQLEQSGGIERYLLFQCSFIAN